MTRQAHTAAPTRMPPLAEHEMDVAQKVAAAELIAGPRKAVKGPFIALMRSPQLLARLQKVGEFLRFESSLTPRASEFAMLVVSRDWTQQFEWFTHVPLALKAGTSEATVAALRDGRRPTTMDAEERLVYDFTIELLHNHGVCDATYAEAVARFGERGVVDLVGLLGYFVTMSMVLNVARTPEEANDAVEPVQAYPL